MATYRFVRVEPDDDQRFDVDGEIVDVCTQRPEQRRRVTVLVREDALAAGSDAQGVTEFDDTDTDENDENEWVCGAETSNGYCTRSVPNDGVYCWQHV